MSSTLAPDTISERNPIKLDTVTSTLASLGLKAKEKDLEDYTSLLIGIWEVWDKVDQLEDYVPSVDEERFPRTSVHRPEPAENPLNAWAWKCEIRDASGKSKGGLLEGKTVSLKDNIAVKHVPCLMGTDMFSDWTPNTDATLVTRILEAGGTVNGKAVCENMSSWAVSCSAATGPMSNIHAPGFSAGGSSSGNAILVGTGASWGGIGGDQGGSIRLPAAMNGIVGMKATTGLVPFTGVASLEPVVDHTGPMTRSVLDNALLLRAIAGVDGMDDRQQAGCPFPGEVPDYPALAKQGVKGMKIGILKESLDRPKGDKRVSELVVKAAKALEELGCTVEEVSVPLHAIAPEIWAFPGRFSKYNSLVGQNSGRRVYCMNDLADKIHPITQDKFDKMWPSTANALINGKWAWENMPPSLVGKATNLIRKLKDDYYAALDQYDALILPTAPMLAPKLPAADASVRELMSNSAGMSLNTSAFNLTGMPAMSLPVGFIPSLESPHPKLPVGMQIVSKFYKEDTIYRVAYAWEQAFDWRSFE
ncbi:amidase signature domain-containing protein [Xylariaceae sp. FL0016]|nr:amidase signature domain-containing protein [Xylariaceae sp. FL0016]